MGVLNLTVDSFSTDGLARDPAARHRRRARDGGGRRRPHRHRRGVHPPGRRTRSARPKSWRGCGPCCAPSAAAHGSRCQSTPPRRRSRTSRSTRACPSSTTSAAWHYDPGDGPAGSRRAASPVVLMHMRGRPDDMYAHAQLRDVVERGGPRAAAQQWSGPLATASAGIGSFWIRASASRKRAEHSLALLAHGERPGGARPPPAGRSVTQVVPHRRDGSAAAG